jgi:hypothetical protein
LESEQCQTVTSKRGHEKVTPKVPLRVPLRTEGHKVWFQYRGREWKIERRAQGREVTESDPFYVEFVYRGQKIKRSLGADKTSAVATAKPIIDAAIGGNQEALKASKLRKEYVPESKQPEVKPGTILTVGAFLKLYENSAELEAGGKAQKANPQALRNCMED